MLTDKIVNATYAMMCALDNGKADQSFLSRWTETMLDIMEGVKDLEGAAVPDRQRAAATGPNVINFMERRNRRVGNRAAAGKPL